MARIGIYGGTFNPPHIGHMSAVLQAVDILQLDKVLLIPDRIAPHKILPEGSPSPEQRFQMLSIAARPYPQLEVSDLELLREGPSYTYQTVQELHRLYPKDELILLVGTDMFLSFDRWKNPEVILRYAALGVFYRGEMGEEEAINQKIRQMTLENSKVTPVRNRVLQISSTDLRRMLVFRCADDFLPEGVNAYIQRNDLYQTGKNYRCLPMERLEQVVSSLLKPDRVNHVLGCRDTAAEMARHWGANETDAARAGLLHDITKALDAPLQLTLCREYGIVLDKFSAKNPKTLHALTGSLVAERIFGENGAVVDAIRYHTTGKADMNLLEKIIYVADYVEPNRNFPGVDQLRSLAFTDLDEAMRVGLHMTLEHVRRQGGEISPESLDALSFLEAEPNRNFSERMQIEC